MDGGQTWLGLHAWEGWEISVEVESRVWECGADGGGFKQTRRNAGRIGESQGGRGRLGWT